MNLHVRKWNDGKVILWISIPLTLLIILTSSVGLLTPDFYAQETLNWQAQSLGQDAVDLFLIAPLLLITSWLSYRNHEIPRLLWSGVILYVLYAYVIYCFDVHFNRLFVLYCLILGLAFFGMLFYLLSRRKESVTSWLVNTMTLKVVEVYLIVIAIVFYILWLSEIIPPTITGTVPDYLIDSGLPTNPVHVLDLAVFLPGMVIISILIQKKHPLGLWLTPTMLVFFVLMDITIGVLTVFMKMKGLDSNLVLTVIMGALAVLSLVMLGSYLRNLKEDNDIKILQTETSI